MGDELIYQINGLKKVLNIIMKQACENSNGSVGIQAVNTFLKAIQIEAILQSKKVENEEMEPLDDTERLKRINEILDRGRKRKSLEALFQSENDDPQSLQR